MGRRADVPEGGAVHCRSLCTYPGGCIYAKYEVMKCVMATSMSGSEREGVSTLRMLSTVKSDIL